MAMHQRHGIKLNTLEMTENNGRVAELIKKHLQEALTEVERVELDAWVAQSDAHRAFFNRFEDKEYVARELELMSHADTDASLNRTLETLGLEKNSLPGWVGCVMRQPRLYCWQ